jgi:hypothetical protein
MQRKEGKKSNGREKKENPNKDKTCTIARRRGTFRTHAGRNSHTRSQNQSRVVGASRKAKIEEEGEIILVLATQGEKYVYLDDDKISDNEDSILEVFTSKMEVQSVDISNAYQYAPIIESVKYLEGLDACGESRLSDDDDEDKSQGGNISFFIIDKTTIQPTMEALVDKDMWIADMGATIHVTNSKVGGENHRKTTVKQGD